jgi:hypothetical protein
MVEKKRVKWDGEELAGLVKVNEVTTEKSTVEVPSFRHIREVQSDVRKLPPLVLTYKFERNTDTQRYLDDFFENNRVVDIEVIRTDAHGIQFGDSETYLGCEGKSMTKPAYDAANPTYAQTVITVIPGDIIPNS